MTPVERMKKFYASVFVCEVDNVPLYPVYDYNWKITHYEYSKPIAEAMFYTQLFPRLHGFWRV